MLREKPVPALPVYGLKELELADSSLNRATYLQNTGKQAPLWDGTKPIKRWVDEKAASLDPAGAYIYNIYRKNPNTGAAEQVAIRITNAIAAAPVNLPGGYAYPPYFIAPTSAVIIDAGGYSAPVRPDSLSTISDALALKTELAAVFAAAFPQQALTLDVVETDFGGADLIVYPPEEMRRTWVISVSGYKAQDGNTPGPVVFNVGLLIKSKYTAGVGAPGAWNAFVSTFPGAPSSISLNWASNIPQGNGQWDHRPEYPVPMRELHTDEMPVATMFGIEVHRAQVNAMQAGPLMVDMSA